MRLKGKVTVITGAGSGLGAAAAAAFAAEGATVVLGGRRLHKLEAVAASIEAAGGVALAVQTDVTSESEAARLIDLTVERFGRVDILINNAAVYEPGTAAETSPQSWRSQIETNLTGPFLITQACLPYMRRQRYGRIISITSALAANGAGGFAAYAASKAGLESLTRTIAEDEEAHNILANLLQPGPIRSEMHRTGKDPQSVMDSLLKLATLSDHSVTGRLFEAELTAPPKETA